MTLRTCTHAELVLSPLNVRTNEEDANATEALEASIAQRGLLMPLVVHTITAEVSVELAGRTGVLAGGRRWRAIGRLIERGEILADTPIDCVVRELSAAEIIELSLSENLLRRELRPYEVHAAIARAADEGAAAEDIAARCGQRVEWVRQQLRLGRLAPEIFAAYAEGRLSADQAQAYAGTEDHALQRAAFKALDSRPDWQRRAGDIRAFLKIGDAELEQLLGFVGEDVYHAAGGGFELDLFNDGAHRRGRVTSEELLKTLAETKLAGIRDEIRVRCQDRGLRFAAAPPQRDGMTDYALEIMPLKKGKGKAWRYELPDEGVIATLAIDPRGEDGVSLRFWWGSRAAKRAAEKAAMRDPARVLPQAGGTAVSGSDGSPDGDARSIASDLPGDHGAFEQYSDYAQRARAAAKDKYGLTSDGIHVVRALRTELLRALLVDDATAYADGGADCGYLGRDFVIWSQLRQLLTGNRSADVGARGLASDHFGGAEIVPRGVVEPYVDEMAGHEVWTEAVERVRKLLAFALEDPAEAFEAFVLAPERDKCLAGAVLAGHALIRSANIAGWRIPALDKLARLAGGDAEALRGHWAPTPAFAGLFPKLKRLELAQPYVDPDAFKGWHKLDDRTLTGACAHALQGDPGSGGGREQAAAAWVHPALSFGARSSGDSGSADDNAPAPGAAPLAQPAQPVLSGAEG